MAVTPLARQARPRRWSGVLAWALWALAMLGLAVAAWLDYLQRQAGSPETAWLLQPGSVPLGVAVAAPLLLVLLFTVDPQPELPDHPEVGNPLAVPVPVGVLLAVTAVGAVIVLATLVAAAGSLVVRFRRARGVERQQLRWLAVAAALGAVALLVAVAGVVLAKPSAVLGALGTCVALLPLATGAAILR